jgi:hypothetical protein
VAFGQQPHDRNVGHGCQSIPAGAEYSAETPTFSRASGTDSLVRELLCS